MRDQTSWNSATSCGSPLHVQFRGWTNLRRVTEALPALEVSAEDVSWSWNMRYVTSGARTLAAGFSRVSIRAARLHMDCKWAGRRWNVPDAPSPEAAIVGILRHAPPTLRSCCLGAAPAVDTHCRTAVGSGDDVSV